MQSIKKKFGHPNFYLRKGYSFWWCILFFNEHRRWTLLTINWSRKHHRFWIDHLRRRNISIRYRRRLNHLCHICVSFDDHTEPSRIIHRILFAKKFDCIFRLQQLNNQKLWIRILGLSVRSYKCSTKQILFLIIKIINRITHLKGFNNIFMG